MKAPKRTTPRQREESQLGGKNHWSPLNSNGKRPEPRSGCHTGHPQGNRQWRGKDGTRGTANFSSATTSWGKGPGGGHLRQRLAPSEMEGVGETLPQVAPCNEGDTLTKPELNRVQSPLWETCPSSFSSPGPKSYHRDPEVSSTGSVCIGPVSNSNPDVESSEHEESGNRKGPYQNSGHCAHRGVFFTTHSVDGVGGSMRQKRFLGITSRIHIPVPP